MTSSRRSRPALAQRAPGLTAYLSTAYLSTARLAAVLVAASCVAALACGPAAAPPPAGRDLLIHGIDVDGGWSRMASIPAPAMILEPDGRASQFLELPGASELLLRGEATQDGSLRVVSYAVDAENGSRVGLVETARLPVTDGVLAGTVALGTGRPALIEVEYHWASAGGTLRIGSAVLLEPAPPRPPVVFISLDTFAARHTSLHGYPRETTPRLDAFAAGATVFERCLSNAAWTTPSYLSQFTGLLPSALRSSRVQDRNPAPDGDVSWNDWFLADARWTLAEMLRGAGYRTAAFVDNPMVGRAYGVNQGFEVYDTSAMKREQHDVEGGIRALVPLALDWLDGLRPGQPFFLFVQANDCHGPYLPPPPFAGAFADDGLPADPPEAEVSPLAKVSGMIPAFIAAGGVEDAELPGRMATAPLVAAYDEEILLLDDGIGRLLDGLAARGLLDGALVVISADHGESMLEHGTYFGHTTPYDEVLHVPLVIRTPGGRGAGRRVPGTVQLVDLYPTLAELLGIPVRGYLHGRSLVPMLGGANPSPRPVLSTEAMLRGAALDLDGWKLVHMVPLASQVEHVLVSSPRARRWLADWIARQAPGTASDLPPLDVLEFLSAHAPDKARQMLAEMRRDLSGAFHELYHVAEDPLELRDLVEEEPERAARLADLMAALRERAAEARLDVHPPPGFRLSQQELAELRALGYVGAR